jgi:hypothetical protein
MICCSHSCETACVCPDCGCVNGGKCTGYFAKYTTRCPRWIRVGTSCARVVPRDPLEKAEQKVRDAIEVLEYAAWQFKKLDRPNSALFIENAIKEMEK